ncbi:MAG: hydrogenase small subunit [Phycisphaerae bacterium]|nr:hydrogenase small subunit [Phycisphaerae bacterium]
MVLTRREFLESGVGALSVVGFSLFELPGLGQLAAAAEPRKIAEIPVLWVATGSCTGCSVSLLNSASPTIQEALLAEILPGKHLSLGFHTTVMAASGDRAIEALRHVADTHRKGYVLVVDGATATKANGLYCGIGERGHDVITGYEHVRDLGQHAMAVLAVGACAAFGGIPAADPNPTGAVPVSTLFEKEGITTPCVNIPGCPPHPDWIVGTIATLLMGGLKALKLDAHHRPAAFFSELIHDDCCHRGDFERGRFARRFGETGCLFLLGCKGPVTQADCPVRKFNNGTNWCCEAGHPCIGCCHPEFPFDGSMFRQAFDHATTGQLLDQDHAGVSCTNCHADDGFSPAPSCKECHDSESGVSFPARRPGRTVPVR